jgi:site-specific recombinase XerD
MNADYRFAHQISRFLKEMQAVGRQQTTIRTYRRHLHYFVDYATECGCENDVRSVGSELLKQYRFHVNYQKKDISTDTRIRLLLCLKNFYARLVAEGLVLIGDEVIVEVLPEFPVSFQINLNGDPSSLFIS